ncbi:Hypothetical predicted protein [Mytilus galloprovincialis]|uniref:DZIP3-like HEPN domain-containing protein n=1 Tax=Mytilus galloprovincialis TaxID=29158 RepID=A0A8B6BWY0_MYTGA|nr:Hypothetical predicted protein [Mytilus galloprovincialis]
MDREDRRRFFVIGSAILEVVTPVFRHKLENNYTNHGVGCLRDYLNSQPVVHTLFHLRHRYMTCCKDNGNCRSNSTLPINYCQWELLYTENPGSGQHYCYCKHTAKSVQLEDLDITLAGLILLNCCTLGPAEQQAIKMLRQYKNDYLSHNTKCGITKPEYDALWPHLTNFVLQLDPSRQDELVRIKNRPMDESLCTKYFIDLLDVHKQLDQIAITVQELDSTFQTLSTTVHGLNTSLQGIGWNIHGSFQGVNTTLQGIQTSINTEKVEKTIDTGDCTLARLCGSGDSIFYTDESYVLYHYSHSNNQISGVKLSLEVSDMTVLKDGSVYVICENESVQHVSSDGKMYKQVTTKGLASLGSYSGMNYNPVQGKLVITDVDTITVFNEC